MFFGGKEKSQEEQDAALAELKAKLEGEEVPGRYPGTSADDSDLRRFLVARDFDVVKADTMVRAHIAWRKETFPIERDAAAAMLIESKRVGEILGWNSLNEPVVLFDCAWGGLLSGVTSEKFISAYILFVEEVLVEMQKRGSNRWVWLAIGGAPPMDVARQLSSIFELNYPELLHVAVIAPIAPRVKAVINGMLWFLPERTKAKFALASSSQEACSLMDHKVEDLPEYLRDVEDYERTRRAGGVTVDVPTEEGHRQVMKYLDVPAGGTASLQLELDAAVESVTTSVAVSQPLLRPRLLVGEHDVLVSLRAKLESGEEREVAAEQMVPVSSPFELDWKKEDAGAGTLFVTLDNTHSRMSTKTVTLGHLVRSKQ